MNEMLSIDHRRFLTIVEQWLHESTDLVIERHNPNVPDDHALYLLSSMEQLHSFIDRCRDGDYVTVVRGKHLPIRGFVNEDFITFAEQTLNPDLPFTIMASTCYPAPLNEIASGTGLRVLRRTLSDLVGRQVWVGEAIQFIAFDDITERDEGRFLFGRKAAM